MRPRFTKLFKSLVLVLGLSLCLSGCIFKSIIFDRLDWVLMYQIDSYLDLEKAQELKLKPSISEAIAWLKREKGPSALATLEKLEDAARRKSYDESANKALTSEIDSIRSDLFRKYEQPVVELFASLSDKQLDHLQKKLAKSNEDLEEALEDDDADAYEGLLKRQKKTLNEYYGELSKEQEKAFYGSMLLGREQVQRRLAERKRFQAYFIDGLRSRDKARVIAMVQSFRDTGEIWQDPSYTEYRKATEQRWEAYLVAFHKSLSDKQWKRLEEKLAENREDLRRVLGRE